MVQREKAEASVLVIEEEGVPWYYDIMKFLELGAYRIVLTRESVIQLG